MHQFLKRFSPNRFSLLHIGLDAVLLTFSLYLSLWMRLGEGRIDQHLLALNNFVIWLVLIRLGIFLCFGIYQSLWRYISTHDASRLAGAVLFSVPFLYSFVYLMPSLGYLPRSLFFIDAFVSTALLMAARLARRRLFEWQMRPQKGAVTLGKMIIYGAGQNGRLLAQRLLSDPARDRELLGYIDDDPAKRNKQIQTLPVLGHHDELENIIVRSGCTELVVAITSPPSDLMRELVVLGRRLGVRVQRIAHFDASTNVNRNEALYRQVELKDLLNRASADVDLPSLKGLLENKVVLVTGAGGSIGSEVARQIARFSPGKLLLLDHSEFALYEIDRELRPSAQDFSHIHPLMVDIKDQRMLENVFEKYKPEVVFHAAAYKHVHLVEANVAPAVLNNVQGTWNLIQLCERFGCERFVMISTDKAVNPVGAMGATKRVCELLTSLTGKRTGKPYSSVRFGNVLGSSGSLIPLLSKQIQDGGPVTVTHPDMTRYFMLIPEAVSLVLMSATLSEPGDINVLKMGEPIRILDLARSLMALMGKSESEVGIAFTGVRPGEKMFEELYLTGDELTTRHAEILTVPRGDSSSEQFMQGLVAQVERLIALAENDESELLSALRQMANPSGATGSVAAGSAAVGTADNNPPSGSVRIH
ncbi:MAG: polysaccharide biosynthesis protein [Bdellovibrionales bacterium]|nr:polysaccharide biosynthesis protein [Bdellovibrionales bacterium]